MKTYYVYELFDQTGQIVYVGISQNPKKRFRSHTKYKPVCSGMGYFYGREDLDWRIHSTWPNKKSAWNAEGIRKLELGFEWTEKVGNIKAGKIGGSINVKSGHWQNIKSSGGLIASSTIRTCPHCNIQIKGPSYFKKHGERCEFRRSSVHGS